MNPHFAFGVAVWILLWGLYGVVSSRHLVQLVGCLAIIQSSTYVLLLGIGYRTGGTAPIFKDAPENVPVVDPVVQSLMLTDVVVEATVMALVLALALEVQKRTGSFAHDEIRPMRG